MTTTPQDLLAVALDPGSGHPPAQGDLSLALAGAELIDLLAVRAVTLDDDRIVPGHRPMIADPLLDRAASSLVRRTPYEPVDDWLWRRGRGLAAAYLAALHAERQPRPRRHHRTPSAQPRATAPADTPARRAATDRWTSHEPVLTALATATRINHTPPADPPDIADDAVATVLAAVNNAVTELNAVRQRRAIEDAAFDNIWRGAGT